MLSLTPIAGLRDYRIRVVRFRAWLTGDRGLSAQYPFKLPLSRQLLFTGSDSHHGFLGHAVSAYRNPDCGVLY
jgi:hypothetical protein